MIETLVDCSRRRKRLKDVDHVCFLAKKCLTVDTDTERRCADNLIEPAAASNFLKTSFQKRKVNL